MKLLIVEDEIKLGNYLKQGLNESGFVVDLARNGTDGEHLALNENYDLIILDIMLPGASGLSITQSIRRANITTPILLLTALGATEDKVRGLDAGADDYLTKPFDFAEVLARVRACLRRGDRQIRQTRITVGDLFVDTARKRVTRGSKRVELTAKEFLLLEFLLLHRGEVVTRSLIAASVWDMNFDSDTNVIDVAIKRLRQKIDVGFEPKLIHTVRSMGYVLEIRE
ncbi:MAG: heavy metal response regulator transcription factor [Helicobacteraceae bacterium]|nr:heavy metal response regulator transcription factor [Helicobacteraceae bacterium]